jgi:hypothetical protein
MSLSAAGRKWTQAENMGFDGPIKSVSTTYQTFMQQPATLDGHPIIYSLSCGECEFDRAGNQVKSGWMDNGHFSGNVEHKILDELGRVREEIWENEKGEVTSRNLYTNGPAGMVRDDSFVNGKLFNTATYTYDSHGNVVESNSYKPDGTLESKEDMTNGATSLNRSQRGRRTSITISSALSIKRLATWNHSPV